jgi:transposase
MGRVYKAEFRREAVRLALSSGLSRERIAEDLGIVAECGFLSVSVCDSAHVFVSWLQKTHRRDPALPSNVPDQADPDLKELFG